ncbi:hypothetical protein [Streptomyces sp. NPDC058295]|uniref:hypothetical protein n=1 Tax=Streptomyces sp. NPDC058295 TaxID=3346431 RepID=UPI0036E8FE45
MSSSATSNRLHDITDRHTESLGGVLRDLKTQNHVSTVDVQIRYAPQTPAFKLCLFNGTEALHGPYEVIERQIELAGVVRLRLEPSRRIAGPAALACLNRASNRSRPYV